MDAVEFLNKGTRMCHSYKGCVGCPMEQIDDCCMLSVNLKQMINIVEQWAKEHPVKTRQSELLKLFPDVDMHNGVLEFCPQRFGYFKDNRKCCEPKTECNECKCDFWLKEIE